MARHRQPPRSARGRRHRRGAPRARDARRPRRRRPRGAPALARARHAARHDLGAARPVPRRHAGGAWPWTSAASTRSRWRGDGSGVLRVEAGWVGFEHRGVQSLVPAGAWCRTRPGRGPGHAAVRQRAPGVRRRSRRARRRRLSGDRGATRSTARSPRRARATRSRCGTSLARVEPERARARLRQARGARAAAGRRDARRRRRRRPRRCATFGGTSSASARRTSGGCGHGQTPRHRTRTDSLTGSHIRTRGGRLLTRGSARASRIRVGPIARRFNRMSTRLTRALAVSLLALAPAVAHAGPPLLCFPMETGGAPSLPWGGRGLERAPSRLRSLAPGRRHGRTAGADHSRPRTHGDAAASRAVREDGRRRRREALRGAARSRRPRWRHPHRGARPLRPRLRDRGGEADALRAGGRHDDRPGRRAPARTGSRSSARPSRPAAAIPRWSTRRRS